MKNVTRMCVFLSYCLLTLLIALPIAAYAQSDVGSISGFVRDKSGAVVPNATVTVRNEGTEESHKVQTDSSGHYAVTNLSPANYSVTAEANGFNKFLSVHNPLPASTALAINGALAPGSVNETVEVTASAVVLQTESGSVQSEISGKTITDQQLNGRNPLFMGSLLPGMRSGTTLGDFNFAIGSSVPFNVNGARQQDTLVTFDGAPAVRTRGSSQVIGVANPDAIEEMQILTSDYQAEYGSSSGGQMRIVSKSGTRDFHATAYEYLRNSAMNANTWTRNHSPTTQFASPFRYNNFGFTFGGPVYIPGVHATDKFRQKFFFFVSEDWIRYRFTDTQTQAVPTTLMRKGNFSELLTTNPWYASPTYIYDPSTCPVNKATGCQPFNNNTIPMGGQSVNGMAIIDAYPAPTPGFLNGTQNWIAQAAHPINQRKQSISVDIVITDHHHLSFRRQNVTYNETLPFDQGSGLTGRYFNRPNQTNGLDLDVDHQPQHRQRSACHLQSRSGLYPCEYFFARIQPWVPRHQFPLHHPRAKGRRRQNPDGQRPWQLLRIGRWSLSISLWRPHLYLLRQLDPGVGKPHHQGRRRDPEFRRKRQRSDQRFDCTRRSE